MNFVGRVFQALNPRELLKYAFLFLFFWIVLSGVARESSRIDPGLLMNSVLLGLFFGWLISRIPLPPWAAGLACGALAVESALAMVGRLDLPFMDVLASLAGLLRNTLVQQPAEANRMAALLDAAGRLLQTPAGESIRLNTWLVYVVNGVAAFDPVASALVWSLVFHLIAVFAGWVVGARRQALPAVLPGLACLSVVVVYSRGEWAYVLAALALILVLAVYMEFDRREEDWIRRRLPYAADLRMDLLFASVVLLPGLLAAAAVIPAVNLGEMTRWVREQLRTQGGSTAGPDSLGIAPGAPLGRSNIAAGMPAEHLLHGGVELTNQVMLVVVTGESPIFLPGSSLPAPIRHYWRGESYDIYTGRGWASSPATQEDHAAGERMTGLPDRGHILHQEVSINREEAGALYLAGDLLTVDRPFEVLLRSAGDIFSVRTPANAYAADAVIPDATEARLRAAGTVYPDWIRKRYLKLPAALPDRVPSLAVSLTASAVTPYDQALAIQNYLRRQYTYSLDITAAPPGRDVVDYFLFDSRTGYCDYYASAMVVLARAAGIPARLATGFGPGSFNLDQMQFIVIEADAHSWPELYFPDIGWVEFEPTSSMAVIRRPDAEPSALPAGLRPGDSSEGESWAAFLAPVLPIALLLPLLLLAVLAGWLLWIVGAPLRVIGLPAPAALRMQYRSLLGHARRLNLPVTDSTTPLECADRLADADRQRLTAGRIALLRRVAEQYGRMTYGGWQPVHGEGRIPHREWLQLDWGLWGLWFSRRFRFRKKADRG
jgi:transglutaminase-like putative cysteine protease